MKRLLSSILAFALGLGSVPVQAQVALGRVSLQTGISAPTPVPGALVPAAGSFTPSLSAPALSVSLTPAAFAPLIPGPVTPLPISAILAAPVATPARSEIKAPLEALRVAASPEAATLAFDGAFARSAAASVEPPVAPQSAAQPRLNILQRYRKDRAKNPLQNAFGKVLFVTTMSAAAVPALWGAAPAMKLFYAVAAADALMLAVILPLIVGLALWRKLSGTPQTASQPPPSRRAKFAVILAAVVLGVGLAAAPYHATGPVAQQVGTYLDRGKAQGERQHVRWISGGAVEDETVKALSLNPVGRDILNSLRDRGGVLRLPTFFISRQSDSYAKHENFFDGVYLNEGELTQRGWTVEQFLKDPALQRRLIREMNSTVFHELVHAVQGRRPPWTAGYFKNSTESEQEAFFRQTLFLIAELEADPSARNNGNHQWMIPDAAADLDGFLKTVAGMYEKNVVVGEPYFNAFLAEQRARWPTYRVHIYQVLAARAHSPAMAKMYLDKAKAAAKEAGLPEPAELVAVR